MNDDFEKTAGLIYGVLDFLPEGDPLKNKAKERVLAIVEAMSQLFNSGEWLPLKSCLSPQKAEIASRLFDDAKILEEYLKIGKYRRWINGVNFLIAAKECGRIREKAASLKKAAELALNMPQGTNSLPAGADESVMQTDGPNQSTESEQPMIKKEEQKEKGLSARASARKEALSERQRKILKMMASREKTQVADIVKEMPDITKRTIRRDLDDLLKRGKVLRLGEWNEVFYKIAEKSEI